MRNAEKKFCTQNSHNWLSAVKFAETCRKLRPVPTNANLYHYAGNNPVKYTDPDGKVVNFVIGAAIGFVTAAVSEIGEKMMSGQSLSEAAKNTFTSGKSWAVMGASAAIGAATSGVSGIAVKAATSTSKAVISLAAKEGTKEIAKVALKTTLINTASGAVDAGLKDVATKGIKGQEQNFGDTFNKMTDGATTALLFTGITEGCIAVNTATSGQITNVLTGTKSNFNMHQPKWAGSVGVTGESIVPAALDIKNELKKSTVHYGD